MKNILNERLHLGLGGVLELLDRGKEWDLSPSLREGGSALFPHAALEQCGHQVAGVVHAVLDSGADQVLAIGVLHLLNNKLYEARELAKAGGDFLQHPLRGVQGPGLPRRCDWEQEYSLSNFIFLLEQESKRRGVPTPHVIRRFPFLVGGQPETLPGIEELEMIAKDAIVVTTGDLMHHGVGYLTLTNKLVPMETKGPKFALSAIQHSLDCLQKDSYLRFRQASMGNKSDAHEVGQILRHLLGPLKGIIHNLILCDTTAMYRCDAPNWVAASLVEFSRV